MKICTKNPCWRNCRMRKFLLVMKITTFLLFITIMQVCATGFAQNLSFSQKQITFKTLFREIKKQTGYSIFYSNQKLDEDKKLDASFKNTPLHEVLEISLNGLPLTFTIEDKAIYIKEKEKSFIENIIARFQAIDVRGQVVDSLGNGIAGATVNVKGFKQSTQTAANGDFYLKNVDEGAMLVVSYLGYVTKEQAVSKNFNRVQLELSTSKLDEVQILAYGKTSRRLSTGTIVTIKGEDIAKQNITNPLMALQGRVPNLVITPASGLPNSPVNLQLRGQNSLSMNQFGQRTMTQPLIVVDGVPFQNNISTGSQSNFGSVGSAISILSTLNINNIEQIDVLTDADATSIYGSRGGNGVILITTKKGKSGTTSVNINISNGFSEVPNRLDLLSTSEYIAVRKEAYANAGLAVPDKDAFKNFMNYDLTVWDQNRYTDWQEEFLGRRAPATIANFSISGGVPSIQYLLSGNYNTSKQIFPGSNKNQSGDVNLNLNTTSANGKFKAFLGGAYSFVNTVSPYNDFTRLAVTLAPNAPSIYKDNGDLNWESNPDSPDGEGTWINPYAQLFDVSESKQNGVRSNANLSYEVIKGVNIRAAVGYNQFIAKNLSLQPMKAVDPILRDRESFSVHNILNNESLTVDPQLTYNGFISKGKIDVLFGGTYQQQSVNGVSTTGLGYSGDNLLRSLNYATSYSSTNYSSDYRYVAFSGRIAYNWDDRYLINLTGRRDGSTRFGPGHQFGNFWSLGSAWIFSNEKFVKDILPVLSFGKFRASYGTSGNDGIGDYQFVELYQRIDRGFYQGLPVIRSNGVINPDYHWESIKKLEFGVETGFFKDRILLSVSRWRTRSSDQLGYYPLPSTAGAREIVRNQEAKIQNSGWDFALTAKNIERKDFSWVSSYNLGLQRNKLLAKPEGLYDNFGLNATTKVGEPFSGFAAVPYVYKGVNPINGFFQFLDRNGDITTSLENPGIMPYRKINIRPLTLGVSNNFRYGNVSLDFFLQFTKQKGKNYLFDDAFATISSNQYGSFSSLSGQSYGNLPRDVLDHWRNPGDIASIQRFMIQSDANVRDLYIRAKNSDLAYVDASFIRLRTLQLAYQIPGGWTKSIGIKTSKVYLQGQNLLTITDYKGLDPETQSVSVLPLLRSITAGVQVEF